MSRKDMPYEYYVAFIALNNQHGTRQNLLARKFLLDNGFIQSLADPCLYTHAKRGIILLLYVNDIPAIAKDKSQLDQLFN